MKQIINTVVGSLLMFYIWLGAATILKTTILLIVRYLFEVNTDMLDTSFITIFSIGLVLFAFLSDKLDHLADYKINKQ